MICMAGVFGLLCLNGTALGTEASGAFPDLTPNIVTPRPGPAPRFNGATVFGVRPGSPIQYTVAVSGQRPMTFSAEGLP
ncbi:MAG: hypothetical protein KBA18_13400, partial [Kiritimatiellae bacterium]|nr:hypothetical protein [Kiritimatiellia bacterium]